jgi:hypothetical protein
LYRIEKLRAGSAEFVVWGVSEDEIANADIICHVTKINTVITKTVASETIAYGNVIYYFNILIIYLLLNTLSYFTRNM